MENEFVATIMTPHGLYFGKPCQTIDVQDGHLVVTGVEGVTDIYAPGYWNAVSLEAVQKPEAG